ncbi:TIGR02186 family protein [Flavimaricola marinus]|uniref:Putative transmembrane protein (Alph_Pro_TM) n=1 Tax=Flavimaricola marinus TaxID=1819565 RepID=A0A238L8N6_9RHOB|nr:TIGR02186 family protein [Flavimaricola marinus]SMY06049.1 Putative transmembrane protein (Alph_Pro_TM) [Flavimaricola marinus]
MIRLLLAIIFWAGAVQAEEIVMSLSQDEVAITTVFDGSDILIYGAIKRDRPTQDLAPLEVVISVSGPLQPVIVRHKERRFGIWVNTSAVTVDAAPSFYAVASTGPLPDVLSETEDLRHSVSIGRAIRSVGADVMNSSDYSEALIRIRAGDDLYQRRDSNVDFDEETLFSTSISLPANLVEGDYPTRIFLTRDKEVVDRYDTVIHVQKVGLERWLYNLSRQQPMVYGFLSLLIAVAAGWSASAAFAMLRR